MNSVRPGVMVFLYKPGQILLQLRSGDAERYPGYWGGFGGRSEAQENVESAAVREIREELGITLDESELRSLGNTKTQTKNGEQILYYFAAELHSALSSLSLTEGDGFALFDREGLKCLKLTPETEVGALRLLDAF